MGIIAGLRNYSNRSTEQRPFANKLPPFQVPTTCEQHLANQGMPSILKIFHQMITDET